MNVDGSGLFQLTSTVDYENTTRGQRQPVSPVGSHKLRPVPIHALSRDHGEDAASSHDIHPYADARETSDIGVECQYLVREVLIVDNRTASVAIPASPVAMPSSFGQTVRPDMNTRPSTVSAAPGRGRSCRPHRRRGRIARSSRRAETWR